jgi:DNA-binding PadR family transcriptional regulator
MFDRHLFQFERQSRLFEKGDLKYVILNLIKDKPSHGYEIMRALEESFHGFYTPSAGSVYPTLQMLDDMNYVSSSERDGKRVFTITPEGIKFLKEKKHVIEKIQCQMKEWWGQADREEFHEAVRDLRGIGRLLGRRGQELTQEKWRKVREIVSQAARDVNELFNNE